MAYEKKELGKEHPAPTAGFLVVRLIARNTNERTRVVVAECKVDGVVVASGSAADSRTTGVDSLATQTFTVPIHGSSTYEVTRKYGEGDVEIRWVVI